MNLLNYDLLSQKIYIYVRKMILSGKYETGMKIKETKLAHDFNISRTPIREALRLLAAEGFLENIPNKGIIVRNFNYKDIKEIIQVREIVEALAGFLACSLISKEELSKLELIHNSMEEAATKKDLLSYSKFNEKFHEKIVENCGNSHLTSICNRLNNHSMLFKISIITAKGRMAESQIEHKRILDSIKKRDCSRTKALMQKHLKAVRKYFVENESEILFRNKKT